MERRKLVNGHNRALLLKLFMDRNLSGSTRIAISEPIKRCDESERERLAQRILDLIQECETEEEMLQNLRRLL